jgi:rRNA maturation protein Nop10
MKWQKQPNGKWKLYSKNVKDYNYYATYSYRDKVNVKLKNIWLECSTEGCKECGGRYNLAEPCPWHLSDSYEHRKQFTEFLRKRKAKAKTSKSTEVEEYKGLYE